MGGGEGSTFIVDKLPKGLKKILAGGITEYIQKGLGKRQGVCHWSPSPLNLLMFLIQSARDHRLK